MRPRRASILVRGDISWKWRQHDRVKYSPFDLYSQAFNPGRVVVYWTWVFGVAESQGARRAREKRASTFLRRTATGAYNWRRT